MPSKPSLVPWAVPLLLLACSAKPNAAPAAVAGASGSGSGGEATQNGDDQAFAPAGLANTPARGQVADGLTLVAFTLKQEASGLALYAAIRNDRPTPACEAGMTTNFNDLAGQLVTTATSVLESAHFYRLKSGPIIRCVKPGEIAMTGDRELPKEIALEQLGSLEHAFPSFTVDELVPVDALAISDVHPVTTGVGELYAGTLTNELELSVRAARVAVFPVNRVGRPLGMATASAPGDLPPGDSWRFETDNVPGDAAAYAAYPAGTFTP